MSIRTLLRPLLLLSALALSGAELPPLDGATDSGEPAIPTVVAESPATAAVIVNDVASSVAEAEHQLQTGEFLQAEQQLTATVATIERETSRYDRSLATPLMLLGDALSAQGKYGEALPVYKQAAHVVRVNDGLHSAAQVEIVYREADALAALGEVDEANGRQEYAYETMFRSHQPYDEALIPGVMHLAQWYERTADVFAARALYTYATLIAQRAHGDLDPALIPMLRGVARTYRDERFPAGPPADPEPTFSINNTAGPVASDRRVITINRFGDGEQALAQIVRITQADPAASPMDLAQAELNLGDWYMLFEQDERAVALYVHARQIMQTSVGMSETEIAPYFDGSTALWLPIPRNPKSPPAASNPTDGYVEIGYTLNVHGQCTNLKTLGSQPPGLMDVRVRRGLRAARFRPRLEGDSAASADDQVYRHPFTYYPRPPEADEDAAKPGDRRARGA